MPRHRSRSRNRNEYSRPTTSRSGRRRSRERSRRRSLVRDNHRKQRDHRYEQSAPSNKRRRRSTDRKLHESPQITTSAQQNESDRRILPTGGSAASITAAVASQVLEPNVTMTMAPSSDGAAEDSEDESDSEEDEEDKLIRIAEERKRRQAAILAKHAARANTQDTVAKPLQKGITGSKHSNEKLPPLKPTITSTSTAQDSEFDMFSTAATVSSKKMDLAQVSVPASVKDPNATEVVSSHQNLRLVDNWDDTEGYYNVRIGEVLNGRYDVRGNHGKGVFSTVLFCDDQQTDTQNEKGASVAIKVIRNNDTMRRVCQKEVHLLKEIMKSDPRDKRHCIRLLDYFEHRNHPCMVFENMNKNLRETLDQFGKGVGISLEGTHHFARQLVVALAHLERLGIVHADLKPDNILIDNQQRLKLCDFGSAFKEDDPENRPTPYLVSRFYRAPEIILGMRHGLPIDTWSAACCFFEVYVGKILFPGNTNNQMLSKFMDAKGKFSNKMIRKHIQGYVQLEKEPHFSPEYEFKFQTMDPVTKETVVKLQKIPERPLGVEVRAMLRSARDPLEPRKKVENFGDLLEKMLTLDPVKRMSIRDVLQHPFFTNFRSLSDKK